MIGLFKERNKQTLCVHYVMLFFEKVFIQLVRAKFVNQRHRVNCRKTEGFAVSRFCLDAGRFVDRNINYDRFHGPTHIHRKKAACCSFSHCKSKFESVANMNFVLLFSYFFVITNCYTCNDL